MSNSQTQTVTKAQKAFLPVVACNGLFLTFFCGFRFWGLVTYFVFVFIFLFIGAMTSKDEFSDFKKNEEVSEAFWLHLLLISGPSACNAAMALFPDPITHTVFEAFKYSAILNFSTSIGFFISVFLSWEDSKAIFQKMILIVLYTDIFFAAFAALSYGALS